MKQEKVFFRIGSSLPKLIREKPLPATRKKKIIIEEREVAIIAVLACGAGEGGGVGANSTSSKCGIHILLFTVQDSIMLVLPLPWKLKSEPPINKKWCSMIIKLCTGEYYCYKKNAKCTVIVS
jgi:hypothetical protein